MTWLDPGRRRGAVGRGAVGGARHPRLLLRLLPPSTMSHPPAPSYAAASAGSIQAATPGMCPVRRWRPGARGRLTSAARRARARATTSAVWMSTLRIICCLRAPVLRENRGQLTQKYLAAHIPSARVRARVLIFPPDRSVISLMPPLAANTSSTSFPFRTGGEGKRPHRLAGALESSRDPGGYRARRGFC